MLPNLCRICYRLVTPGHHPFIRAIENINYNSEDLADTSAVVPDALLPPTSAANENVPKDFLRPDGQPKRSVSQLSKFHKIVVQLLSYYFPLAPTYGPVSPHGQNRDTNGLEGSWWQVQQSLNREMETTAGSLLESLKKTVQKDTYDVSDMKLEPIAVKEE